MAVLFALSPAIALLCLNAALLIPKVRGKAISIAGRRVGLSGTADSLTYSPWGGVQVSNFKVGDGSVIRADSFSLSLDETKLFSRVLSVRDVALKGGNLTFLYRPPARIPSVVASVSPEPSAAPVPKPESPPIVAQEKIPPKPPVIVKKEAPKRWRTSIGAVQIEDVRFAIRDQSDGADLILAEDCDLVLPAEGEGEVSLGLLMIVNHKVASGIRGDLERGEEDLFNITSLSGSVLGAPLTGSVQLAPKGSAIPFAADVGIKGLTYPTVVGAADASVKIQGSALRPQSWSGQVQIKAAEKLSLKDFPSTEFIQAQLQAVIQGGIFQIADARAIASGSGALSLRASGHATLGGDLAINLRPYVFSDALPVAQKLLSPVFGGESPTFALLPSSPLAFTDFAIRGKATAPQLYFSNERPPINLRDLLKDFQNPGSEN